MKIPIDLIIHIIKSSEECKQYLTVTYPYEYEIWTRFSVKNGEHCEFARAALRRVYQEELKKHGEPFIFSLGSQEWGSRRYQESIGGETSK